MSNAETAKVQDNKQFQIHQLYVKRQEFEAPNVPTVFNKDNWSPKLDFEIQAKPQHIKENLYEVVLTVKVKATSGEQKAFDCEVQQAGLFIIENFNEDEQKFLLSGVSPNVLYPYARKVLSDLVVAGGFPPVTLAPMNFEALYMQEHQKQKLAAVEQSNPVQATAIH
ncbi:MAG: protein translocase subunit secB [Gammaproteobacteria bacterium]|jgi:preprotein translocase subunit SecB|nr:protein translocase subunit secB [Gammaproteobacteria bacterium]